MKCSLPVRSTQILVPTPHKIAISRQTKFFGTFWLFFLDRMDLLHYQSQNIQKTQSLQILICSLP